MGDTKIQWADKTWNPTSGCTKVTTGCAYCYAEREDARFHRTRYGTPFVPWNARAQRVSGAAVTLHPERLDQPMHWNARDRRRLRVFVDSMSDLFHEDIPDSYIDAVFGVMALVPQHDFLVLTKRPERAITYLSAGWRERYVLSNAMGRWPERKIGSYWHWPLRNVWIGVSVTGGRETPRFLDLLKRFPAAVRFVSYEPALQDFDFRAWLYFRSFEWLIAGHESGPQARPGEIAHINDTVIDCQNENVPVFVKQLHLPGTPRGRVSGDPEEWPEFLRVRELPVSPADWRLEV